MNYARCLGLCAGLLSLAPVVAQNPREGQLADPAGVAPHFDPVVATSGDLSVLTYIAGSEIYAQTSDGKGKVWSAPVRVDSDVTGARKDMKFGDVQIVGNSVFAIWKDERNGTSNDDCYFSYSTDGGLTWAADVRLDAGIAVGVGAVRNWYLATTGSRGGRGGVVHVLLEIDPTTGSNEDLYLVRSLDGGVTFQPGVYVPQSDPAGTSDVDTAGIAANGPDVWVAWIDNRTGSDDVWFQHSNDVGATWTAADLQLDTAVGGDAEGQIAIASSGLTVAVAWTEEVPDASPEEIRATVSLDGGLTFPNEQRIGGYAAGVDDCDNVVIGVTGGGSAIVCWEDDRSGGDIIYSSASSDGGATWSADATHGAGGFPRVAASDTTDDAGIVYTGGGFPEDCFAATSTDGGVTWAAVANCSQDAGDVDFAEGAYNALYGNLICAWLSDTSGANLAYVGGVRSQTCTNNGWGTLDPTLSFSLSGFGTDAVAIVIMSENGNAPFPVGDGRSICLLPSPLTSGTISSPAFLASLTAGAGSTPALPNIFVGLPPAGISITFMAFGVGGSGISRLTDSFEFSL